MRWLAGAVVAAGAVLTGLLVQFGAPAATAWEWYLTLVAAAVAWVLAARATAVLTLPADDPVERSATPPPSAAADRHRVDALAARIGAAGTAGGLAFRLVPVLRSVAAARLAAVGVDLVRDPQAARRLLGADLHDHVRPDAPRPPHADAPGVDRDVLAGWLDRLERL